MSYLDQLTDVFAEFIVVGDPAHEEETVMKISDLGAAMGLLGIPNDEENLVRYALKLDSKSSGFIEFEKFVEVMGDMLEEVVGEGVERADDGVDVNVDRNINVNKEEVDHTKRSLYADSDEEEGGGGGGFMQEDDSEGYAPSEQSDSEGGGFFQEANVEEEVEDKEEGTIMKEAEDKSREKKVEEAFELFTKGEKRTITLKDLRRISKEVKDTATDEQLMDMIRLSEDSNNEVDIRAFSKIMKQAKAL